MNVVVFFMILDVGGVVVIMLFVMLVSVMILDGMCWLVFIKFWKWLMIFLLCSRMMVILVVWLFRFGDRLVVLKFSIVMVCMIEFGGVIRGC